MLGGPWEEIVFTDQQLCQTEYKVVAPPDQELASEQEPDTTIDLCNFTVLDKSDTH